MRISVGPGTYVVAVSGGVDSMVLLDLLRKNTKAKLIIAHFDHGIRDDSHVDRLHVQNIAKKHGLMFVHHKVALGPRASEATARAARYAFLHSVRQSSGAQAIITAHHQNDVLETAIINLLRGSGRRGLTSLRSTDGMMRPLLGYEKEDIVNYANDHAVSWREDPTNQDTRYTRNYVRLRVIPRMTPGQRAQLIILLSELHGVNDELDQRVVDVLHAQPAHDVIERSWFVQLPHAVAREVVYGWLRQHAVKDINRNTVERLVIAIKTAQSGKKIDINKQYELAVGKAVVTIKKHSQPRQKTGKNIKK